jgi:MFS family permease
MTRRVAVPRGVLALLVDRTVGWYFAGKVLSSCGIWIQNIAAAVLMFELTRSAFMVGLVSTAQFLGPLVLAMWAGGLSDRIDRRKLLMAGRLISGTAVSMLATLLSVRGVVDFGGPWMLLAAVLVMGIGMAVSVPAMQALVPSLVEPEELESALALSSAAPSIARTVGPAVGAGLLVLGGPAVAFGTAGITHLLFAAVLVFIRPRRAQTRPAEKPRLLGGVRYLLDDRKAGSLMLGVVALGIGADAMITLGPSKAELLGGGSELVGLLASAFGVGSVAFLFILGPLRRRTTLRTVGSTGYMTLAAGLAVTGVSATTSFAVAGMFLAGLGFMMGAVALNTRIQRRIPDDLRGRVMALWLVAFAGSRPIAALLNGTIAELVSVQAAFVVGALLTVTALPLVRVRYNTPQPDSL